MGGLGNIHVLIHSGSADVFVPNWVLGKPAAFDLSVTSMLNTKVFQELSVTAGSAALLLRFTSMD